MKTILFLILILWFVLGAFVYFGLNFFGVPLSKKAKILCGPLGWADLLGVLKKLK